MSDEPFFNASRSYAEFLGYQREDLIGRSTVDLGIWVDAERRRQWKEILEKENEALGFETTLRRKDGSVVIALLSGKVVDIGGERCIVSDTHDITEQKQYAKQLEQIAYHDPLTGLPNRLLLGDRLNQAMALHQRAGTLIAVCYLDLDGFKEVNDKFGHQAGDQLLIEVSSRLAACVRGGDTVARLGGDEFIVLLLNLADDKECRSALDRLLQTVSAPYVIGSSQHAGVSASIGVTLFPSDYVDPDILLRHADQAMYSAKQAGKNRYQMFDAHLERRI